MKYSEEWSQTEALLDQLDRLDGREWRKKRDTILALVDARIAGREEETVWPLPQTCNRSIYHSKWKKEPIFAEVLATCTQIAKRHQDSKPARAVIEAGTRIKLASPAAAGRLVTLLNSEDEAIVMRAAVAILDRASSDTAPKVEQHATISTLDDWRQDAERRRAEAELMLGAMDGDEEIDGPGPGDAQPGPADAIDGDEAGQE